MISSPPFSFAVVILGAGASSRMGQPKLLLPWGRGTVIAHLVEHWRSLGAAQIALVTNRELEPRFRPEVPEADLIINAHPEEGMFSSICCAANWAGWKNEISHMVIALGDQPHLAEATMRPLLELAERNRDRICQPSLHGRARHPVILPRGLFEELARTPAETLKEFLAERRERVKTIELEDMALDLDIDTPADYEAALQIWQAQQAR